MAGKAAFGLLRGKTGGGVGTCSSLDSVLSLPASTGSTSSGESTRDAVQQRWSMAKTTNHHFYKLTFGWW